MKIIEKIPLMLLLALFGLSKAENQSLLTAIKSKIIFFKPGFFMNYEMQMHSYMDEKSKIEQSLFTVLQNDEIQDLISGWTRLSELPTRGSLGVDSLEKQKYTDAINKMKSVKDKFLMRKSKNIATPQKDLVKGQIDCLIDIAEKLYELKTKYLKLLNNKESIYRHYRLLKFVQ
ncbi:MAG: hypothetical protein WA432_00195 [Candidatus Babeliaceae bacterium]